MSFANRREIDIVLIQEPYTFHDRQRRITKCISSYEILSPNDDWSSKPRVLSYLRKGAGLQECQLRLVLQANVAERDILFLEVTDTSRHNLLVINLYNTLTGSINKGKAVHALCIIPRSRLLSRIFLAGHLKIRHLRWQTSSSYNSPTAQSLLE